MSKPIKLKAKFNKVTKAWNVVGTHGNLDVYAEAADPREALEDAIEYLFELLGEQADLSARDEDQDVSDEIGSLLDPDTE